MRFGPIAVDEAAGAILAHSLRAGGVALRKGKALDAIDVAALSAAGIRTVTAARIEPDDVAEDAAAARIAAVLGGAGIEVAAPFTGRVNLFARTGGLLVLDAARVDRLNLIDEAVTLATLPAFAPVEERQMVATVKIIPFAAKREAVEAACAVAGEGTDPLLRVAPFRALRAGLVQTRLAGTKEGMLDKTTEVTRRRLHAYSGTLDAELRCPHDEEALAVRVRELLDLGIDLLLIAGASAITDRRDVLPAGIMRAGGTIEHFGMPVDPGNLLLLAHVGGVPVLGLPGCARSPKLNGFDWVLERLAAGLQVTRADIMRLGVGGLLAEIPSRPQPRLGGEAGPAGQPHAPRIAAVVLAAGSSRRMGTNKLLESVDGQPIVARVVDTALASQASRVLVVTGHQQPEVVAALAGRPVTFAHNPAHAGGLGSSLRTGIEALPGDVDGALICLGDMPDVRPDTLDRLIAAYSPAENRAICVPTTGGRRGNPVLWDRRFFAEMSAVAGDVGARHLIGSHADHVVEVALDDPGILLDVDTPDALEALRRTPR